MNVLRQGSNELDRSCSRERSSPVMLSAAKHLAADRDRPFAALRVTGCDESTCQGLCFTIARIAYYKATSNAVRFDMSLLEAILREDALHNNSSGSQQVCTFNRHSVIVGYLLGRFPLQFMQSLVETILCHNELLWIGGELKQVIGTATHKNSTLTGKREGKFVHEGSDVICQSLNLFFGGRIVGQELLRHIACANR